MGILGQVTKVGEVPYFSRTKKKRKAKGKRIAFRYDDSTIDLLIRRESARRSGCVRCGSLWGEAVEGGEIRLHFSSM